MRPWDMGQLDKRIHVVERHSATCHDASTSNDPEALKCFGIDSNYIYEPCWPSEGVESQAICPRNPWDSNGVLLQVEKIEHIRANPPTSLVLDTPWAMELADGQHCTSTAGATGSIAHMRINYVCNRGVIVGSLDQKRPIWRALFAKNNTTEVVQVNVRQIWAQFSPGCRAMLTATAPGHRVAGWSGRWPILPAEWHTAFSTGPL
jgi:hypothetical protein